MYQFFVEPHQIQGNRVLIEGGDVNHIKNVLRMKTGERVRVSLSYNGRSFFGIIDTITEDEVIVTIESEDETGTELSNRIYLF
jgi:16S rRNA (uracil1498-N3)-methyltransferase